MLTASNDRPSNQPLETSLPMATVRHVPRTIESLHANGFVEVDDIFSAAEIDVIEPHLDALVLGSRDRVAMPFRRELSCGTAAATRRQPEVSRPTLLVPQLKRTAVFQKCRELAGLLLGCPAHYLFDHAIYKMPFSATETPWHQDLAYLGEFASRIRSLHFWIPLQDTDATAGALRFVAGSHSWPLLTHVSAYEGNLHVLTIKDASGLQPVAVPVRRGGVCIHTPLTLHSAGVNDTSRIRKAWIVHFGDKPLWYKHLLKCGDVVARGAAKTQIFQSGRP